MVKNLERMNKKAFLRIAEASISIVIIMGTFFFLYTQQQVNNEPDYSQLARETLIEIGSKKELRTAVMENNKNPVENFISNKIPQNILTYEFKICPSIDDVCGKSNFTPGVNVYAAERIISSTLNNENFEPKKIRLFLWTKTE